MIFFYNLKLITVILRISSILKYRKSNINNVNLIFNDLKYNIRFICMTKIVLSISIIVKS